MDASGQIRTVTELQIFVFAMFCHPVHSTVDATVLAKPSTNKHKKETVPIQTFKAYGGGEGRAKDSSLRS
jgi:hypothetical protein